MIDHFFGPIAEFIPIEPVGSGKPLTCGMTAICCFTTRFYFMQSEINQQTTQVLVIGSGVAGLSFALQIADSREVLLISKSRVENTNTAMAQGGIASVMASKDDFANHVRDTLLAGAGLCDPAIVNKVVRDGPSLIQDLENWGVEFDQRTPVSTNDKDLHREGGHSHRRILHVQDHTGLAIHNRLMKRVREHPNIQVVEHCIALELITEHQTHPHKTGRNSCLGASFYDIRNHKIINLFAPITLLATGGAGKTYLYTSNWEGATGDGIAMAYRAGCRVANMEFMQFHPTCLYHQKARNFLISEALRGEGAELVNKNGDKFTYSYHPLGPLAPRDIVARAIDNEMKKTGAECVFLDIRHQSRDFLTKQFPFIYEGCLKLGIDISTQLLPVVPAAHYLCGGILTDECGQTDLDGLYAVGECAQTGLHGANRLASNSLLECLAFAHYAFKSAQEKPLIDIPNSLEPNVRHNLRLNKNTNDELILISHLWDEIRTCMWNYVGIVRSNKRLERALTRVTNIESEIHDYYLHYSLHRDIVELRNLALVARLTIQCAIQRSASIGTHFNCDSPMAEPEKEPRLNVALANGFHC